MIPIFWIKLTILRKETWEKKRKKKKMDLGCSELGADEDVGGGIINIGPLKGTINIPHKQACSPIPFVM